MDSSKQFGGDASLKDYMDPNDGAASSTISVEQQAQTLARMTLFEKQRRRRLSATRAAVRKDEAGTADARARRRRDKLAALSPLAKAAGVAATDGVHVRLAKCDRCSTRSIHRARSATSARTRELAASAGRAALRRQRGPREALDAQRAEAPVTPGAVVAPVPHAKLTGRLAVSNYLPRHRCPINLHVIDHPRDAQASSVASSTRTGSGRTRPSRASTSIRTPTTPTRTGPRRSSGTPGTAKPSSTRNPSSRSRSAISRKRSARRACRSFSNSVVLCITYFYTNQMITRQGWGSLDGRMY